MKLEAKLLLFLLLFASAIVIVGVASNIPTPHPLSVNETTVYLVGSELVQPMGDPVDNPRAPS